MKQALFTGEIIECERLHYTRLINSVGYIYPIDAKYTKELYE